MVQVRLYTKAECSLCEDALELLEQVRQEIPFALEQVDIRSSAELFSRYRHQVPVVAVGEVDRLRLRFSRSELEEILR